MSSDDSSGPEHIPPKTEAQANLPQPTVTKEDALFFRKEKEARESKTTEWKLPEQP